MLTIDIPPQTATAHMIIRDIGGDDLLAELMQMFVAIADDQMPQLAAAQATHSGATVARIAHTLKSSAFQLGAMELGEACRAAERAAEGKDIRGLWSSAESIRSEYAAARTWMSEFGVLVH